MGMANSPPMAIARSIHVEPPMLTAEHPTPPRPFYGLPIQLLARLDQRLRQPSGELLLLRQLCCVFHGFDGLLTRDFWQLRHTHLEPLQPSGRDGVVPPWEVDAGRDHVALLQQILHRS